MASALDRALGFLGALVVDDDGARWGERATPIQWADARAVLDRDGPRKHWIGRSRGYSKTDDLAAMTITALKTQLSTGMEAIGVASDRDQSRLLVDHMRPLVQRTPELADVQLEAYGVRAGNVRFECLAADAASAWGRSPAWCVVDEPCQWADTPNSRQMWQAIATAIPKVRGRLVLISTAGDPSHFSREIYESALEDPLWRVSEVHGPAPWLDPEELASERKRLPESAWQRFFENRWCSTEDKLLILEELLACVVLPGRLDPVPGCVYVVGVDLAVKRDNAVVAVAHAETVEGSDGDRRVVLDSLDVFSPSRNRENDLQLVEGCVRQRSAQYGNATCVFDPAMADQMMQRLTASGVRVETHVHTAQSNSRRAMLLLDLVRGRRLWLPDDDPELINEFAAVRLVEKQPGVYRYDHSRSQHDDRLTAVSLCALHLLEKPQINLEHWANHPTGSLPDAPGQSKWSPIRQDAVGSDPDSYRLGGRGQTYREIFQSPRGF
jgi:hypothetical protein